METGVLSALELAAARPRVILENFYKKSLHAVEEGTKAAPYGYVIPAGQKDQTRVAWVVNTLRLQGIEAGAPREAWKEYAAGSYVVKRNQPYGRLAKSLLERQVFPDWNVRTYDDTGWTRRLTALIDVKEIGDKGLLDVPVASVDRLDVRGHLEGAGPLVAVLHNAAHGLITLRCRIRM